MTRCEICGQKVDGSVKMFVLHEVPCFFLGVAEIILLRIRRRE